MWPLTIVESTIGLSRYGSSFYPEGSTLNVWSPNITGAADWASGTTVGGKGSGSLLFNTGGTSFCQYGEPGEGDVHIGLNASVGNATYGGSTVQPKALNALPCIRC